MEAAKESADAAERARAASAATFDSAVKDLTALHDLLDASSIEDAANVAIGLKERVAADVVKDDKAQVGSPINQPFVTRESSRHTQINLFCEICKIIQIQTLETVCFMISVSMCLPG